MTQKPGRRSFALAMLSTTATALVPGALLPARALAREHRGGAVYVLSNQAAGNAVWVYQRDRDGALVFAGSVPTGGLGTITPPPPNGAAGIDPLASQNAVLYSDGLLFAVNAGSNDISMFRADDDGLELIDRVPSGGVLPVAVAVSGRLVYVLNAGGVPTISGFTIDRRRRLVPLANSTRSLPGGSAAAPAQVSISGDGETLVVTEKGTKAIDVFRLGREGVPTRVQSFASVGAVPFGFALTRRGYLLVAEAGTGTASSYDLDDGVLATVSGAVSLGGQRAPCWLVATRNGRLAFTGNAGTQAISSLAVAADGSLTLISAAAVSLGAAALDLALTPDNRFLYVRGATGSNASLPGIVSGFVVGADGTLTPINAVTNVPPGAQGIAAR